MRISAGCEYAGHCVASGLTVACLGCGAGSAMDAEPCQQRRHEPEQSGRRQNQNEDQRAAIDIPCSSCAGK